MSDQQTTQAADKNSRYFKQAATMAEKYMKQARAMVVEYRGRRRPVKAVDFGLGELVKPLTSLKISMMGEYLCLPGAVAAVITQPNGTQIVHSIGGLLSYPPGIYGLQYVDMRQQRLHLQSLRANSDDALQVTLTLDIIWQVDDVIPAVNMDQPHAAWRSACKAAVLKVIQSNSHDRLVPVPGSTPISDDEIQNAICDEITATPGLSAFKIIEVKVLSRQGDPERLGKVREASVAATQREQELMEQVERLQAQLHALNVPAPAISASAPDAGSSSVQEEDGTVPQADLLARVAEILQPARQVAQELKQSSQSQPLTREQVRQWLEISGSTFSDLAAALQDPASSGADEVFAFMAHAFDSVLYSAPPNGSEAAASAAIPAASSEPGAGNGVQGE